jgi:hypothetical protein
LRSEAAIMTSRLIVAQVLRLGISEKLEGNMKFNLAGEEEDP